jgi:DNA-binding response OmpR family regulator
VELLLVEDEWRFAQLLARRLGEQGFPTTVASTGAQALEWAIDRDWDLAIVDVMLPELDGVSLTRALRERGRHIPILMLTARDAIEDRVEGLRAGADDYVVKPFAFEELMARIEALIRRTGGENHRMSFGPIQMDVPAHRVRVDGTSLELTPKEFELLECLLRAQGRVVTRARIKELVWGFTFDAPTKVVDLYVHYLRKKLDAAGAPGVIETVRGIGYVIRR